MHVRVYNSLSTESNIGSRKICMDEILFFTYFVPSATPLAPPALEMNTQDARVTLIRSIAKLKLLEFDACSFYIERASYFAKLNLLNTEFFVRIFDTFSQTVVKSYSCQFLVRWFMEKGLVPNDLFVRR